MANPDIEELNRRAAQLRSSAEHIESLVDTAEKHTTVGPVRLGRRARRRVRSNDPRRAVWDSGPLGYWG
ncbi:hypothetical protein ACIQ9J_04675 [Streptomyces sp. NPDC094153]|uniref:hypothetical protein n=1 Tax=Streptomyces sp. NPDC094153 TaxID=3366058 RepID=UPI0037F6E5CB